MIRYDHYSRDSYLNYHETLSGTDKKFSKVAIGMWDFMKAWDNWPVRILKYNDDIVSVCFMKISNQAGHKVLFISNIFTPQTFKGKGWARKILDMNIKEAVQIHNASTIRMDCNKSALPFYDKLGITYWGATISHSMYCDLPINIKGVDCFKDTQYNSSCDILNSYPTELREAKLKWIYKKVKKHSEVEFGHPSRYEDFMKLREYAVLDV